jgi:hypothetical protein
VTRRAASGDGSLPSMPTLMFEGETHDEIVRKVRRWLASIDGEEHLSPVEVVERASELTKDALGVIAAAAPAPVAQSELVKALTRRGYEATDQTKRALTTGLTALNELSGGEMVKRIEDARRSAVYEMNVAVAKQVLKALRG